MGSLLWSHCISHSVELCYHAAHRSGLIYPMKTSYSICFDVPDGPPWNRDLYVHLYDTPSLNLHRDYTRKLVS